MNRTTNVNITESEAIKTISSAGLIVKKLSDGKRGAYAVTDSRGAMRTFTLPELCRWAWLCK